MVDSIKPQQVDLHVRRGETTMSDIGNIQGSGEARKAQPIGGQRLAQRLNPVKDVVEGDTVEISERAEMLGKIRDLPDVRVDKVAPIRQAIQAGTYDIDSKLDVAIERLLEDLE